MKKLVSLVLALCLVLASCAIAFADDAGTITVTNAEIGKKYVIYKLFDATVNPDGGTAYTLPDGKTADTGFNTYFKLVNGNVTKQDTLTETVLKSAEFKTWAKGFGTKGQEIVASSQTVAFSNLDYGYYFIESFEPDGQGGFKEASGAILTVDSANPTASVIDKNQTNKSSKVIVEDGKEASVNEALINENVTFKITDTVKNYVGEKKIYQYIIDDQLDPAFAYDKTSVVVKVGTATLAATDYTIEWGTTTNTFTITIPWTADGTINGAHKYDNNSTIVVTYNAKLDADKIDAKPGDLHYGTNPNNNKARLRWNDDLPNIPDGERPWDETETFDTQLTILKKNNKDEILTGAEFTLTSTNASNVILVTEAVYTEDVDGTYYLLKDGSYTAEAPNNNPTHDAVYASTTVKYSMSITQHTEGTGRTNTKVATFVDGNGKATFTGLSVGTYTIEETVVPAGYNKAENITFTISFDPATKKFSSDNDKIVLEQDNNIFNVTIVNNEGTELPSTGGIGTTIFYILGGLLVVGAAVVLVARRRVKE